MARVPILLIYSRLGIGLVILLLSIYQVDNYKFLAVSLLTIGLLTDIFDGIIARKLAISTQRLRRLDSTVDQIFFVSFVVAAYLQCPAFFEDNWLKLTILSATEGLTYLVCFLKFRKEVATHSIGAKIWTLLLFATLIQITLQCNSVVLFTSCFWIGMLTRVEIIAIILTLKKWTNDVPTLYHALKSRHGQEIKRHKLFNG